MSNATGPKPLSDVLGASSRLGSLLRHARQRPAPGQPALPKLPPALAGKVTMTLADNCLVLTVENNAVAQIVRFHGRRLARQAGMADFRIRLQRQQPGRRQMPEPSRPPMPAAAAPLLRATAAQADHPRLAAALERLAALAESEQEK